MTGFAYLLVCDGRPVILFTCTYPDLVVVLGVVAAVVCSGDVLTGVIVYPIPSVERHQYLLLVVPKVKVIFVVGSAVDVVGV